MSALSDRMVARVATIVGLPVGTGTGKLASTDVLAELNRVYQREIPNKMAGWNQRGEAQVTLAATKGQFDETTTDLNAIGGLGYRFKRLYKPVLVDGQSIYFHTDPDLFWRLYRRDDTSQARPSACLWHDEKLIFRPIADDDYTITLNGIEFRQDSLIDLTILKNPDEEQVICVGASIPLAADHGKDKVVSRQVPRYAALLEDLASPGVSGYGHARRRPSF